MLLSTGLHAAAFAIPVIEWRGTAPAEQAVPLQLVELTETGAPPGEQRPQPLQARPAPPELPLVPELDAMLFAPPAPDLTLDFLADVPAPPPAAEIPGEFDDYMNVLPMMQVAELTNRDEVRRELLKRYTDDLRRRGARGSVYVLLWIDETGTVRKHRIEASAGNAAFDLAVAEVVPLMEFTPTRHEGAAVRSVVRVPVHFSTH